MAEITSIKCPKGHENPPLAKYCRTCGLPISNKKAFTPDMFPSIPLVPVSSKNVRFVNRKKALLYILVSLFILITTIALCGEFWIEIDESFTYTLR